MKTLHLAPAYGRDYSNISDVRRDWEADKDFVISDFFDSADGKPVNRADLLASDYTHVQIRYAAARKVVVWAL
jgi:hypothetical protein